MARVKKIREDISQSKSEESEIKSNEVEVDRSSTTNPAQKSANEQLDNAVKQRKKRRTKAEMDQESDAAKVLEHLYDPKYWAPLACAPANTMLAITGNKIWNIPDAEADLLGSNAALVARYLSITDPKWLVIMMATFHFTNSYATRTGLYVIDRLEEKKNAKQKSSAYVEPN